LVRFPSRPRWRRPIADDGELNWSRRNHLRRVRLDSPVPVVSRMARLALDGASAVTGFPDSTTSLIVQGLDDRPESAGAGWRADRFLGTRRMRSDGG
jgi:hypothetical protein